MLKPALLLVILLIVTGCALLPPGNARTAPQAQRGPTPTPIPTPIIPTKPVYTVERGTVINASEFLGRVSPVVEQELFFRVSGRVRTLSIKRDDPVTKGQVLADLEIDNLERELASGLLALEQAEQELKEARLTQSDQLARAKLHLEIAQAQLTKAEQSRLNDLARARISLSIKLIELAQAQSKNPDPRQVVAATEFLKTKIALQKAQEAYDEIAYADAVGSSSQAVELEQATLNYERAQAAYELALQDIEDHDFDLEKLKQEVALAELEVERLEEGVERTELALNLAEAQLDVEMVERGVDPTFINNVERARLNVQKLEAAIADAQIIAPFTGVVLSESLTEGQEAAAYRPAVVIADLTDMEITAVNLDSSELIVLAEGMAIIATLSARPGEVFNGIIRQLPYPYAGGGLTTDAAEDESDKSVRIALNQSTDKLGLEMGDLMHIKVILEEKEGALWLPPQAVRNFEGRHFVTIQDGETQRRVDVKVGIKGEERVEIEEGLTEGQIVIGP